VSVDAPPAETAETPAAGPAPVATPSSRRKYRTGFCGGSVINGVWVTHAAELHRLCTRSSGEGGCSCECHRGVEVWEGRDELGRAAANGDRALVAAATSRAKKSKREPAAAAE
jgi:hypothetical protein